MTNTIHTKCLIIGSGPAGCTAAIYAARAGLSPIMLSGMQPGGQLTITTDVENYPGFADVIQGPVLVDNMIQQAKNVGTDVRSDEILSINASIAPYLCQSESGTQYSADTIIIATGAQAKWLGLDSEKHFMGFGVSGCATCDGFFFRGKKVLVVGGGNTAVEEALYLTNHAAKVTLVHRRDSFRAENCLQQRLFKHDKIEVVWNHVLDEILGVDQPTKSVTGVNIKNVQDNQITYLPVDGVFIAIGHSPNTKIFQDVLDMDSEGYILTKPDSTITNMPGIFAAGDVRDKIYRQAVTAAGNGCMAALEAEKFLNS